MQDKQSPGTVTVNQSGYIDDCLERLCKPVGTPANISAQLSKKFLPDAGPEEAVSLKTESY